MTTHAGGVTGAEDVSLRATGATVAGGGIGAPEAMPLAPHGFEMGIHRSRESNDSVTETARSRAEENDDEARVLRADRARRALALLHETPPGDSIRDRQSDVTAGDDLALQVPNAPVFLIPQREAFDVVRDARSFVTVLETEKETTQLDYQRKVRWMWRQVDSRPELTDAERWCLALDAYVQNDSSFRGNKAACLWHLRCNLRLKLSEQDEMQRRGDYGQAWLRHIGLIRQLVADIRTVEAHVRFCPPLIDGMTLPEHKSKKRDLLRIRKKYPDWMARILMKARHTSYLDAVRVLSLVGCRPEELHAGVDISLTNSDTFCVAIKGAKVSGSAGQPWRRIYLPVSRLPWAWRQRLQIQRSFSVVIKSKDGLRNCLQRCSKQALPGQAYATAYVYRHAFATRLRDAGFGAEEVGAFLGHSVAETQAAYGIKAGGRGKRLIKRASELRVEVPREVRPLDRSGLKKVQATRKARKSRVGPAAR